MSRHDAHSRSLRRRPSRTVPAVVVAVVLLALGVGLAWGAVLRLSSGSWPEPVVQAAAWAGELTWAETLVAVIAGAMALLGLIMVFFALSPGRPSAMWLDTEAVEADRGRTEVVMTRRSVARLARARADEIDGVDSVSSTVGHRTVSLSVTTASAQRSEIRQVVTATVDESLRTAGLNPMPRVAVKVRTRNP